MPLPSSSRRLLALVVGTLVIHASALYVVSLVTWNDSASVPRGLYLRRPTEALALGRIVIFPVPSAVRDLVAERGYLPPTNTLMKTIAALPGDTVCLDGDDYRVNGRLLAHVRHADSLGRTLPLYRFCDGVPAGQAYVTSAAPLSFDSRYFGPVALSTLTVVTPLWMSSR
jgi:conjugative transfer signal peptidase TraF